MFLKLVSKIFKLFSVDVFSHIAFQLFSYIIKNKSKKNVEKKRGN